jgi:hypothetical protein
LPLPAHAFSTRTHGIAVAHTALGLETSAMEAIAAAFESTLIRIGDAMRESFAGATVIARWGVAGLREEALVFLLAESMRTLGWTFEYERSYGDGSRQRVDLDAAKGDARLWIEAKWWWLSHERLRNVLAHDRAKLAKKRGSHRAHRRRVHGRRRRPSGGVRLDIERRQAMVPDGGTSGLEVCGL